MSNSQGSPKASSSKVMSIVHVALAAPPISNKPDPKIWPVPVEDLECTICLEVPASPIHACANGHIICGICSDNVKKCGICRSEPFYPSFFAERLSRQFDFKSKCPNFEAGCLNQIASTDMKDHISKCYYRNVVCCRKSDGQVCNKVSIPLKDFPKHLQEKHGSPRVQWRSWSFTTDKNKLPEGTTWPLGVIQKNDQSFLVHKYIGKKDVYFWITVLADKAEAKKHMYKLTLEKERDGKKMEVSWTLPVLPYHDYPAFKKVMPLFVTIPAVFLYEFCITKEEANEKRLHSFTMSHCIL